MALPPWALALIPFGANLIWDILFPKESAKATQETTTTTDTGWRDPGIGLLSPLLLGELAQNYNRYQGWGMPKGMAGNSFLGQNLPDLIALLTKEYPKILEGYNQPTTVNGQQVARIPTFNRRQA